MLNVQLKIITQTAFLALFPDRERQPLHLKHLQAKHCTTLPLALTSKSGQMSKLFFIIRVQAEQEVSGQFKAEPTASHTRCNLEQVGHNSFVQAEDSFLS
jgi:hypothetical protein